MAITKNINYNILDIKGHIFKKDNYFDLNILQKSGNYLIHKDISRHKILSKQNTSSTKTRGEVRGGGRKPWKQKGTGRARAGSNRSPLWKGGGVIFGPKPKNLTFKLNKKERKLALQTLLYNKRNQLIVVNNLEDSITNNKTKNLVSFLKNCLVPVKEKILLVVAEKTDFILNASYNLKNVNLILASNLNTLNLLNNKHIILSSSALTIVKEVYCE
jgi:large subunit ribosomal protein L4